MHDGTGTWLSAGTYWHSGIIAGANADICIATYCSHT